MWYSEACSVARPRPVAATVSSAGGRGNAAGLTLILRRGRHSSFRQSIAVFRSQTLQKSFELNPRIINKNSTIINQVLLSDSVCIFPELHANWRQHYTRK